MREHGPTEQEEEEESYEDGHAEPACMAAECSTPARVEKDASSPLSLFWSFSSPRAATPPAIPPHSNPLSAPQIHGKPPWRCLRGLEAPFARGPLPLAPRAALFRPADSRPDGLKRWRKSGATARGWSRAGDLTGHDHGGRRRVWPKKKERATRAGFTPSCIDVPSPPPLGSKQRPLNRVRHLQCSDPIFVGPRQNRPGDRAPQKGKTAKSLKTKHSFRLFGRFQRPAPQSCPPIFILSTHFLCRKPTAKPPGGVR